MCRLPLAIPLSPMLSFTHRVAIAMLSVLVKDRMTVSSLSDIWLFSCSAPFCQTCSKHPQASQVQLPASRFPKPES